MSIRFIAAAMGSAAALRLLPRRSWAHRAAIVALASALALLVTMGWSLLWALTIAVAALAYHRFVPRRPQSTDPESLRLADTAV